MTREPRDHLRPQALIDERDDVWATTSNKQLTGVQRIKLLLKINGRAAVVRPDEVLCAGGAGDTIRLRHALAIGAGHGPSAIGIRCSDPSRLPCGERATPPGRQVPSCLPLSSCCARC